MQIARQINTGGVKVNGVSLLELNVDAPRPAWGLSGFGEEGTLETFDVFCGKSLCFRRIVCVEIKSFSE